MVTIRDLIYILVRVVPVSHILQYNYIIEPYYKFDVFNLFDQLGQDLESLEFLSNKVCSMVNLSTCNC